jgi:undecaprenyl diphosphate synthase
MDAAQTPRHIGFIIDGNRRWAENNSLPKLEGHRRGYENILSTIDACIERGVRYMSGYVFSTENWKRSKEEVGYLMDLVYKMMTRDLDKLHKKGVCIRWLGTRERLEPQMVEVLEAAEEKTKDNKVITLGICFNYGGQHEIVDAVRSLITKGVSADEVTEDVLAQHLYAPEIPPLDLMIRTSGEQRLSNFMLWRVAYSEFIFRDELWPDFSASALDECLLEYSYRKRRLGA